jgi:hypothetical protein
VKEYLPSKKFVQSIGILIAILCILIGAYYLTSFIKHKYFNNTGTLIVGKGGNIQKDTNSNGIPDWEESLWGFDPTKDGEKNKEAIQAKKDALRQSSTYTSNDSNQNLSEDETAAREFFAAIMSLQQSGNLNDASVQSIAEAMGEKIIAAPIADTYKKSDEDIQELSEKTLSNYYIALTNLFIKYKNKNIGDELTFINQGLMNNDPQPMKIAGDIAVSYKSFAKELIKIPVPEELAQNHLELANNYEKTGQTITEMAHILEAPLPGMKALINYKKYSSALTNNIKLFSDNLSI